MAKFLTPSASSLVNKEESDGSEKVRVDKRLTSGREVVDLSPPQALDRAENFLKGQGYVVVHRTVIILTV